MNPTDAKRYKGLKFLSECPKDRVINSKSEGDNPYKLFINKETEEYLLNNKFMNLKSKGDRVITKKGSVELERLIGIKNTTSAYRRAKNDFGFIYFTISAANLSTRLFSLPENSTIGQWIIETWSSLFITLIAMLIILYIFRGFSEKRWGF